MRYYFSIQFRRINRWSREIGLHPTLLWIGGLLGFVLLCELAYYKTAAAPWVVLLMSVVVQGALINKKRIQWMEMSFRPRLSRRVRMLEHLIVTIPFAILLSVHGDVLKALIIFALAPLLSLIKSLPGSSRSMPTPFAKKPFEFASGFRRTWPVILISYALTAISIINGNANLGVFTIVMLFFILMTNYSKPEPRYFAWVHSMSSRHFLKSKLRIALNYSVVMGILHIIPLSIVFPGHILLYCAALAAGLGFIITSVLSKYAYFPSQIPIAPAIAISLSILFPPLMLITIPLLYNKSLQQMKLVLP